MDAPTQDTRAAIRRVMAGAGCQTHLAEMMRVAAVAGRLPDLEKDVQKNALEYNKARAVLIQQLDRAVRAAKRVAYLERRPVERGLAVSPDHRRVHSLESMQASLQTEAAAGAKGGRPRTWGNSHFAVAVWGVLDRARVPQRQRAGVVRNCLVIFGVEPEQVESAIKYARRYFKEKKPATK